jgi:O-antigen ligase
MPEGRAASIAAGANGSALTARLAGGAGTAARHLAIAIGFSMSISTAADNILLGLLLLCWLASGNWRTKYETIRANPVALAALLLLAMVVAGFAWGQGPVADGWLYLKKYSDLLLVPILVTVFDRPDDRRRALLALSAGIVLTLTLSFALALGAKPSWQFITAEPGNPTVFKRHITQSLFVAVGALLFLRHAHAASSVPARWLWVAASVLAAVNVLFLVQGRTGYLALAGLTLLVLVERLRWKGVVAGMGVVAVSFASAYALSSSFHNRVAQAVSEVAAWRAEVAADSPIGVRLEFYRNTAQIIREHPLLGVGTRGFVAAYDERIQGTAMVRTRNPHNLYLLVTAQFGVIGLAALLFLLAQQWRHAGRLTHPGHPLLARGLVLAFVLAGLFNSLIIDHAEGLLFTWLSGLLFAGLADPAPARKVS